MPCAQSQYRHVGYCPDRGIGEAPFKPDRFQLLRFSRVPTILGPVQDAAEFAVPTVM